MKEINGFCLVCHMKNGIYSYYKKKSDGSFSFLTFPTKIIKNLETLDQYEISSFVFTSGFSGIVNKIYGPYTTFYRGNIYNLKFVEIKNATFFNNEEIQNVKYEIMPISLLHKDYFMPVAEPFIDEYMKDYKFDVLSSSESKFLASYYFNYKKNMYSYLYNLIRKIKRNEVSSDIENASQLYSYVMNRQKSKVISDNKDIIRNIIFKLWDSVK